MGNYLGAFELGDYFAIQGEEVRIFSLPHDDDLVLGFSAPVAESGCTVCLFAEGSFPPSKMGNFLGAFELGDCCCKLGEGYGRFSACPTGGGSYIVV